MKTVKKVYVLRKSLGPSRIKRFLSCANKFKKDRLDPEPEYEFDVTKPDGIGTATVHCKNVEHLNDQRKRRNSISKAADSYHH